MTDHWFLYALASTLLSGLRSFVTKHGLDAGLRPAAGRLIPAAVMVGLSLVMLWTNESPIGLEPRIFVASAALQGSLFYIASICRLEAVRLRTPSYVLYPILQASTPLIVVLSAVLFREWHAIRQPLVLAGILLSIVATYALADLSHVHWDSRAGVVLAFLGMLSSAGATLAAKYAFEASGRFNLFGFILVSNMVGTAIALAHTWMTRESMALNARDWIWGGALGLLNFGSLALFLEAIRLGELSVVASVAALSVLVPIVLSAFVHGERLTLRQEAAVAVSLVSLVILARASGR